MSVPLPFVAEIEAIEAELRQIWPGYVKAHNGTLKGVPFGDLPEAQHLRIKWLLKRHLLLHQGLDWGIFMARGTVGQKRWFCHPTGAAAPADAPIVRGPPWPDSGIWIPAPLSSTVGAQLHKSKTPEEMAPALAFELRAPVRRVLDLLKEMPQDCTDPRAYIQSVIGESK